MSGKAADFQQKIMDERNIPQTDAELDKILPTQGYEVSRHFI